MPRMFAPTSPPAISASPGLAAAPGTAGANPAVRILVADDCAQSRDVVRIVLSAQGLHVTEAQDGEMAVAAAQAAAFDLILMDLSMPVMDGFVATRTLRDKGVEVPILALTAHGLDRVEETIGAAGFSGHVSKPIDIGTLMEALSEQLGPPGCERTDPDASARVPDTPPAQLAAPSPVVAVAHAPPIQSRLPVRDPRYRAIVDEFVGQLDGLFEELERAWTRRDFSRIAELAHYLKGAGGSVGFDEFTAPSRSLENEALAGGSARTERAIAALRAVGSRVVAPGDAPQSPVESR